jgi:hypothetical protein
MEWGWRTRERIQFIYFKKNTMKLLIVNKKNQEILYCI